MDFPRLRAQQRFRLRSPKNEKKGSRREDERWRDKQKVGEKKKNQEICQLGNVFRFTSPTCPAKETSETARLNNQAGHC